MKANKNYHSLIISINSDTFKKLLKIINNLKFNYDFFLNSYFNVKKKI